MLITNSTMVFPVGFNTARTHAAPIVWHFAAQLLVSCSHIFYVPQRQPSLVDAIAGSPEQRWRPVLQRWKLGILGASGGSSGGGGGSGGGTPTQGDNPGWGDLAVGATTLQGFPSREDLGGSSLRAEQGVGELSLPPIASMEPSLPSSPISGPDNESLPEQRRRWWKVSSSGGGGGGGGLRGMISAAHVARKMKASGEGPLQAGATAISVSCSLSVPSAAPDDANSQAPVWAHASSAAHSAAQPAGKKSAMALSWFKSVFGRKGDDAKGDEVKGDEMTARSMRSWREPEDCEQGAGSKQGAPASPTKPPFVVRGVQSAASRRPISP